MNLNTNPIRIKKIYFDGTCPMCTVLANKIKDKDNFSVKDVNEDSLPIEINKVDALQEIHVVDSEGKIYKNAEAIFQIMDEYPRFHLYTKIGRLPIIRTLAKLFYRIVAQNRYLLFGDMSKVFLVKVIVILGLLSGIVISLKLWVGERFFPYIPVFENIPNLPSVFWLILFISLFVVLILALILKRPQNFLFWAVIFLVFFGLYDQMRWQPWVYQYLFMIITLVLFSWNPKDKRGIDVVLNTSRLIVASIYFFSGLQKINLTFFESIFPWFIEPVVKVLPIEIATYIYPLGVFVPFLELLIGVGLLTKKFRKASVVLAILLIISILFTLGPLGHNWNIVVWPWNLVMLCLVVTLFWKSDFSMKDVLWIKDNIFHKIIILLFLVLPFFSFFNLWDSYFSSTLYSGNIIQANLYISNNVKQAIPKYIQNYAKSVNINTNDVDFLLWSFEELNVPVPPQSRIYRKLAKSFCYNQSYPGDVFLIIKGKPPSLVYIDKESKYNCSSF